MQYNYIVKIQLFFSEYYKGQSNFVIIAMIPMNDAISEIYDVSINNFSVKESLDHGNYVLGYTASLLYVMNGLATAVLIKDPISKKKQELLQKNCSVASVPCFCGNHAVKLVANHSMIPSDIDVITILSE